MRSTDSENLVEIGFQCLTTQGTVRRTEAAALPNLRVETVIGNALKAVHAPVFVPIGVHMLALNRQGTLLVRPSGGGRTIVLPPKSMAFVRSGTHFNVQAARGEHEVTFFTWSQQSTPLLDHWVNHRSQQRAQANANRNIGAKPFDPIFTLAVERFLLARNMAPELAEPMFLSVAYECIPRLLSGTDEMEIAMLPNDLPETVRELTGLVKKNPNKSWPLKDASDFAGYSPFHFSRVFKQMVGYGFHEFVDRCRTQMAVAQLCETSQPIDVVASNCGFGTTQGLRESIKEYLGLVPSELRATISEKEH